MIKKELKGLYVLDKKNKAILLNPKDLGKKTIVLERIDEEVLENSIIIFRQLLDLEEYIKFPLTTGFAKINKNTELFDLSFNMVLEYEKNNKKVSEFALFKLLSALISNEKNNYISILGSITNYIKKQEKKIDDILIKYYKNMILTMLEDISDIISNYNNVYNYNNFQENISNTFSNKLPKKIENFDFIPLMEFTVNQMEHIISDGYYYSRAAAFQTLFNNTIFFDFDKNYKLLEKAYGSSYNKNRTFLSAHNVEFIYFDILNNEQLLKYEKMLKEHKGISHTPQQPISLLLQLLKRGFDRNIVAGNLEHFKFKNFIKTFPAWPRQYESEMISIVSQISKSNRISSYYPYNDTTVDTLLEIYHSFFKIGENSEFINKVFNEFSEKIVKEFPELSIDYIRSYFIMTKNRRTSFNYDSVLFSGDETLLNYSNLNDREGKFALMCHIIFRMDSSRREMITNEVIEEIIDKGVSSFIGSSDSYSLRNRMARILASLIHEKEMVKEYNSNEHIYEKPRDQDIKFLVQKFAESKLRSSFFAKIFNMPVEIDSNYWKISKNMQKDMFFYRPYSEFVNIIGDIDYCEELSSVILLLALT
jgi:hypothetical protein